jgi:hypothetical protein
MVSVAVVVEPPDVRLNPDTASVQGGKERDPPPVVIVTMASLWEHISEEIRRIPGDVLGTRSGLPPLWKYILLFLSI